MARLPQPGGDVGNWGNILNDYLSQTLKSDGTLKSDSVTSDALAPNSVTNSVLASDAVDATIIQDGSITETLLHSEVKNKIDAKADDSTVVHRTGNETIAGAKSFVNSVTLTGNANNRLVLMTGSSGGGISLGADVNAVSRTTNVRKFGLISSPNFANNSNVEIFSSDSTSSMDNNVNFGGRAGGTQTAATTINFVTAPDTTTTGGTNRLTIDRNGKIGIGTDVPTHTLTLGSTGDGIALYNTTDQTTNYERVRHHWNGGVYKIETLQGGTGLARNIQLTAGITSLMLGDASGYGMVMRRNGTGISLFNVTTTGLVASSSTQSGIVIDPVINQSGSAGYSILKINPTETTLGSGTKLLIDAQVGGQSKFTVSNDGSVTLAGGSNIITNTTTGTKIATSATQRLGFWNATPITQPTVAMAPAVFSANTGTAINDASTFDGYTVRQVVAALRSSGLLA